MVGMMKRVECIISGRVQMVMYRDFATRKARHFAIVGEVANMGDGTVKVVAEGEGEQLLAFIEQLKKGSLFAHVARIDVAWREPTGEFNDFSIKY